MKKLLLSTLALSFATITNSQTNFITAWTHTASISSLFLTQVGLTGAVQYTWTAMPSANTGTGTINSFGPASIALNCPANNTITLEMNPNNLTSIKLLGGPDTDKLIDIKQWGSVAWTTMNQAFAGCINLQVTATDIPNLTNVTNMKQMFGSCQNLSGPSNINSWNVSNVVNMWGLFNSCLQFNQNISSWNTANVTDFGYMFGDCWLFNQPLNNWNTANGSNFEAMFSSAKAFNQPIGSWNTNNATNMSYMFSGATNFNQAISSWNTTNVTNMKYMFNAATNFNQPVGSWNTNNVTNMNTMFGEASNFNQPIGNWNTSNVTDMGQMFTRAVSFNQDISNWNVSNVDYLNSMFYFFSNNPGTFNQNLGTWTLKNNVNMNFMLGYCGMSCDNYSSTLIGWNNNPLTPNGLSMIFDDVTYGTNATAARSNLTGVKLWTITGDIAGSSSCNSVVTNNKQNINTTKFSLYPNPTNSYLQLQSNKILELVTIADVLGKTIYTNKTSENELKIDLSTLNSGIYFITVGNTTKKIIKE